MAFMMNKLAMVNSCEIILGKVFFAKNHCKIQVNTILVCALYSIKYSTIYISEKAVHIVVIAENGYF
jgi:hypothetical protein